MQLRQTSQFQSLGRTWSELRLNLHIVALGSRPRGPILIRNRTVDNKLAVERTPGFFFGRTDSISRTNRLTISARQTGPSISSSWAGRSASEKKVLSDLWPDPRSQKEWWCMVYVPRLAITAKYKNSLRRRLRRSKSAGNIRCGAGLYRAKRNGNRTRAHLLT